jgi:hypothetical protein
MDARSNFKSGIAYDDLREWLVLAERSAKSAPCAGRAGRRTPGSRPRRTGATNFRQAMPPRAEVARKARERFGWLLEG